MHCHRRTRLVVAALMLCLLYTAAPAQAGVKKSYSRSYYTVKHHISKHRAGANIRRHGVNGRPARVADYRRETKRLRRIIAAARPWSYVTASWYGPGLYGNTMACGGTLTPGTLGVAHKTMACGTRLELRHGRRRITVRVVDRGPYVGGRTFDLTSATARALGFGGVGTVGYRLLR